MQLKIVKMIRHKIVASTVVDNMTTKNISTLNIDTKTFFLILFFLLSFGIIFTWMSMYFFGYLLLGGFSGALLAFLYLYSTGRIGIYKKEKYHVEWKEVSKDLRGYILASAMPLFLGLVLIDWGGSMFLFGCYGGAFFLPFLFYSGGRLNVYKEDRNNSGC